MDALNSSRDETSQDNYAGVLKTPRMLASIELQQLFGVIVRQHKIIFLTILIVLASAAITVVVLEKRYTASAMLVVDESESQLVGLDAVLSAGATLNNRVDTEVEVLKSTSVALTAIEKLKLWDDKEFGLTSSLWKKIWIFISRQNNEEKIAANTIGQLTNDQKAELVDNISDALKVSRRGLTSVISIAATSSSPDKAAKIANAVAEAYFDVQVDARAKSAQRAADFLRARVSELAGVIRENNERIDQFLVQHSEEIGTPEVRTKIAQLRNEITNMSRDKTAKEAAILKLQQFRSGIGGPNKGQLAAELSKLASGRSRTSNPVQPMPGTLMQDLPEENLRELVTKEVAALREQVAVFDNGLTAAGQQVWDLISQQSLPQNLAVDLYQLQRDAEVNRRLYESYVTRLGEVQQKISLALPNSRIMAAAIPPHEPSFPPALLILALSAVIGLVLGGGAAMFREHVVGGFASPEQLEAVTGVSVAAVLPQYGKVDPHNAILNAPFSSFAEAVRRLRIGVENAFAGKRPSVVLVTSTEADEGKTTLAITLARATALSGQRTLLIDCDLRHSSVSRLMQVASQAKFVELLLKLPKEAFLGALGHEKDSGLYVINAESTKQIASDVLLASTQFRQLLETAKLEFDVIIIDSPPIGYVVDASVISRECDVVLYVVRYATTAQRDVLAGLRELLSGPKPPLVINVLNGAREVLGTRMTPYNNYYSDT